MSNLARPASPRPPHPSAPSGASRTPTSGTTRPGTTRPATGPATGPADRAGGLLRALREARDGDVLAGLDPATYARDHRAFEACSDQRELIAAHVRSRLDLRAEGPISVLSVGCGDGTLDARLASTLLEADPTRPVRYVGVEPYAVSAAGFEAALGDLRRPSLQAQVHVATFEEYAAGHAAGPGAAERFDVVTFVHSLYYVADVAAALRAAYALLRPGGELVVLHAPRGALNALVDVLAPPLEGHPQWFSDDVVEALDRTGLRAREVSALQARVELVSAPDDVLDFAVQARLTPRLRVLVREYLAAVSVPGPGGTRPVPHPVETYRVTRTQPA